MRQFDTSIFRWIEHISRYGRLTTILIRPDRFRLNIFWMEMSFSGSVHSWLMASTYGHDPTIWRMSFSRKPNDLNTSTVGRRLESTFRYMMLG